MTFSSWPTGGVNCTFRPIIDHTLCKLLTPSRQMKHLEFRHFLMTSVASFSSNFFSDMKGGISSKQTNSSFWINRLPTKVQLRQVHPYLPISAHKRRSKIFTFFYLRPSPSHNIRTSLHIQTLAWKDFFSFFYEFTLREDCHCSLPRWWKTTKKPLSSFVGGKDFQSALAFNEQDWNQSEVPTN